MVLCLWLHPFVSVIVGNGSGYKYFIVFLSFWGCNVMCINDKEHLCMCYFVVAASAALMWKSISELALNQTTVHDYLEKFYVLLGDCIQSS